MFTFISPGLSKTSKKGFRGVDHLPSRSSTWVKRRSEVCKPIWRFLSTHFCNITTNSKNFYKKKYDSFFSQVTRVFLGVSWEDLYSPLSPIFSHLKKFISLNVFTLTYEWFPFITNERRPTSLTQTLLLSSTKIFRRPYFVPVEKKDGRNLVRYY